MRSSVKYVYSTFIITALLFSCDNDNNDTDEAETLVELSSGTDGFTTADTETVLPETSFGNEKDCKQTEVDSFNLEFLKLINSHRKSIGIEVLSQNTVANYLAFKHTKYMICTGDFNHTNFTESNLILTKAVNGKGMAENIIAGYNTPQKMLDGWLSSSGHRSNIENPNFKLTGFSSIKDKKNTYWATQIFFK